jgi:heterodisulfide reductase subunit A-like polyferredoxin
MEECQMVKDVMVIGGGKTFPTNDCSICILAPKMADCYRHENIDLLTCAEVQEVAGETGNFNVKVRKKTRLVDVSKCTGCNDCTEACPVELPNDFNMGLGNRKAIYRMFTQAVPNIFKIDYRGESPCRATCPAGISGQGYLALIRTGKYKEALELVQEKTLLPGILGRICHHPCETECNRKDLDEPLAICELKRFLADWAKEHGEEAPAPIEITKPEKVAVIGAGPGGLACGIKLMELGYPVTVFDAASEAGGMITGCLPEYRISKEVAKYEIDRILARGLEVKYDTKVGKDISLKDIQNEYKAVYISIGSQNPAKLDVKGSDLNGVLLGLPFLREAKLGKKPEGFGSNVVVIGGGNVAIDCAKTAKRLGAQKVTIVCLETRDLKHRDRMPAHDWEIEEAEEEGVEIQGSLGPQEMVGANGKVVGLSTNKCTAVYDENRKFAPQFSSENGPTFDADTIIIAIGQRTDLTGFEDIEVTLWKTIKADNNSLQTNIPSIFAGGDIVRGPASVIEAIADGNKGAEMIDKFLKGETLVDETQAAEEKHVILYDELELNPSEKMKKPRLRPSTLAAAERSNNFNEVVAKTFTEEDAKREAERCLNCGGCSQCHECIKVCKPEAINYDLKDEVIDLNVGAIIVATGFDVWDPSTAPEYGYPKYANVYTAMEFERLLNAAGPTSGHIVRRSDGARPKRLGFIQCVGSRNPQLGHPYCCSVCCMHSTKEATLAHEHHDDIESTVFYKDLRTFGKGFNEYMERAKRDYAVTYINSDGTVKENPENHNPIIVYDVAGRPAEKEFDMVILATTLTPRTEAKKLAETLGIKINEFGFFESADNLFSSVDSNKTGIYLAGYCTEPMDIPEAVAQASGAAVRAAEVVLNKEVKA